MKQQFVEPLPSSKKTNDRLTFTLDPSNNVLHQISPFIHRHLFTKRVVLSMLAIYFVLHVLEPGFLSMFIPNARSSVFYDRFYKVLMMAYLWLCFYPFFVSSLLKVNRSMLTRITESA